MPSSRSGTERPQRPQIDIRRPWRAGETIFLLGPGGVGKSTLGRVLAGRLNWPLIDLDLEFCEQIAEIGRFIRQTSYAAYRAENLLLAQRLVARTEGPLVFVTASGFLAAEVESSDYAEARALVGTGYGITLLPSLDIDQATELVVERQLKRGFGLERESETHKFRRRFGRYRGEGDMLVVSSAPAEDVAKAVQAALTA
ncbi:shikimate kinase [Devosia sp. ZW T5_3]|uniref:shikimate kinase n=1 Tax=Devosia sp. ZW T5_3 TaxID=3378085 RepID=UPI003852EBC6